MRDIVRESIILNEEVVGQIGSYKGGKIYNMIKNPATVGKMNADIRGISYGSDFYVVNQGMMGDILHDDIIQWMLNDGILEGVVEDYYTDWGYRRVVAWQRSSKSNKFFLSESYRGEWERYMSEIERSGLGKSKGDYYFMYEKVY